jgi:hypothetical protein
MPLVLNGTTGVQDNSGAFVAGTAVASTSGTSIDFTSIPNWVKQITVMFSALSLNGSSTPQVQLGSGSFTTSGYAGTTIRSGGTINSTSGMLMTAQAGPSDSCSGLIIISNITSNSWVSSTSYGYDGSSNAGSGGSRVSISGTLDRVRVTTINGTDTFDAGTINILYE